MRKILDDSKVSAHAKESMNRFHQDTVNEVERALQQNEWVIVGMAHNIPVKNARKYLSSKGISFQYIEYGSYFSKWKARLAIKLWSGWPTFPQVFHKGVLVGGYTDLVKYLNKE